MSILTRYILREHEDYSCPHAEGGEVERVLLLTGGDSNDTGICLDCLMNWVERNRERIWGA